MAQAMFQVLDDDNSVVVTLNDNRTGTANEVVTTGDAKAISWAVFCFARNNNIPLQEVGHTVEPYAAWKSRRSQAH